MEVGAGAIVLAGARVGDGATIGAGAFVRERATIGAGAAVGEGAAVDNQVTVGARVRAEDNAVTRFQGNQYLVDRGGGRIGRRENGGDNANRQELANFLSQFGVSPTALLASAEGLAVILARADAPQVVIVNLDPNAADNLKKLGGLPRQFPNVSFFVTISRGRYVLRVSAKSLLGYSETISRDVEFRVR